MSLIVGNKYGRLEAIGLVSKGRHGGSPLWMFLCDCGNVTITRKRNVSKGDTTSCGCLHKEIFGANQRTHGLSESDTYQSWKDMRKRCFNVKSKAYKNYGGRGITVCLEWGNFENFYKDMGFRPKGKTLERINVNGHYNKENCTWVTRKRQANNKRNNVVLHIGPLVGSMQDWCDSMHVSRSSVKEKLRQGYSPAYIFLGKAAA